LRDPLQDPSDRWPAVVTLRGVASWLDCLEDEASVHRELLLSQFWAEPRFRVHSVHLVQR